MIRVIVSIVLIIVFSLLIYSIVSGNTNALRCQLVDKYYENDNTMIRSFYCDNGCSINAIPECYLWKITNTDNNISVWYMCELFCTHMPLVNGG